MEMNEKACAQIVGPYFSKMLGDKNWFYGDQFTALDVIVSFTILAIERRMPGKVERFPNLLAFNEKVKKRPSMQLLIS